MRAARTLALALLASMLAASPAHAAKRFTGSDALAQAGAYISANLKYPEGYYDPGRLAVQLVEVYRGAFMSNVRFRPSLGHQVVLSKGLNAFDTMEDSWCADFRLTVERFSQQSLKDLAEGAIGPLRIDSSDSVMGSICVRHAGDVTVDIRSLTLQQTGGDRVAFNRPFGFGGAGGDEGGR
ncbi:hypothetical protein [Oceanibaculum pacificum]|uniref:Uncharacterized protein n=1 Tax=Oceanibaculum pacificum TaxID=580166 RepID=A0A154VQK0_9PROT|nr:hypothetical protein [Oceanibaculum pacificum]KZD03520.1 hypothetical protein AUP43_12710 [Oceanibaculum pacificum]